MTTSEPCIGADGLTKRYGDRLVVDRVTFEVDRGECVALLGPNGAGKTTVLQMLQGVRRPSAGSAVVLGRDPGGREDRRWRARIGVVGQSTSRGLDLTVIEMLRHFAHYHARPRPTDELLAVVDLTRSARVRIPALSGGQRRRLEVALALQGAPDLLFLDEPTTGLDPSARHAFWDLADALREEGTTVLLTTHYLEEARRLADRVGVLAAGRLVAIAPPATLGTGLGLPTRIAYGDGPARVTVDVGDPVPTLRRLLAANRELTDLEVVRPSLEDVYLTLLGLGRT